MKERNRVMKERTTSSRIPRKPRPWLSALAIAATVAAIACGGTTTTDEPQPALPGQEFNAAGGEMSSANYQLSFQLGRTTVSIAATGQDKILEPNPILRTQNTGDNR